MGWKKLIKKTSKKNEAYPKKLIKTLQSINNNKRLFLLETLTTLIYIAIVVFIIYNFTVTASGSLNEVLSYLDNISVDDPLAAPLGSDPLMILQHINIVKNSLLKLGLYLLATAYLFGLVNWGLTKLMLYKKRIVEFIKSFTVSFFSFMLPFGLLFFYTFKIAFQNALKGTPNPWLNIVTWILLIIILYFYYIAVPVTVNNKLKDIPAKTLRYSKKLPLTLPIFATSLLFSVISIKLIDTLLEINVLGMIASVLLLLASFSFSRILLAVSFE